MSSVAYVTESNTTHNDCSRSPRGADHHILRWLPAENSVVPERHVFSGGHRQTADSYE